MSTHSAARGTGTGGTRTSGPADIESLVEDAVALAHTWIAAADGTGAAASRADRRTRATAERLGALVADPAGLDLAVGFVDDVARPQDVRVAAKALARLGRDAGAASFLSPVDRTLFRVGAAVAPALPSVVVPAARVRLRQLVGHLVADAGRGLGAHLARTRDEGYTLNVNLLGEMVLGEDEARARLQRTLDLVRRPDVDYVSVKVSSVAAQLVTWDLDGSRERVVDRLLPLYRAARDHGVFVNLDMEEYKDLALTTAVFRDVLDRDELRDLQAGVVLQAYLPDALGALDELTAWAQQRVADGGAPVKVRLVKGANLAMEHVEAELHDWAVAPYGSKAEVDANYVRVLDHHLTPERTAAVRLGVASHNLFHVALAILLGRARGVSDGLDVEMLQGMAPIEARQVQAEVARDGGRVVLYTPVVRPQDFDVAISYLVRRLEENAAEQNFLHASFAPPSSVPGVSATPMDRQEVAFRASVSDAVPFEAADVAPRRRSRFEGDASAPDAVPPGRTSRPEVVPAGYDGETDGTTSRPGGERPGGEEPGGGRPGSPTGFRNAVDTDPSVAAHREWAARIVGPGSGFVPVRSAEVTDTAAVDAAVARAVEVREQWAAVPPAGRARVLREAARRLEDRRTDLIAAAVHEVGKTVAETDPEVTEAIDFANYYAAAAEALDTVDGVTFAPDGVTLVTPPWNFPVAIPIGGALAALAAGSTVLAKPAPPTPRCYELAVEAVHAALEAVAPDIGLDPAVARDAVQFLRVPDGDVGKHLVTHPDVSRVVLTGALETAEMFASWRPERPVLAETSGKNALIVTPSADLDLAVADVLRSAFGHAGQKCSAASLVILVGSVGDATTVTGERFGRQLVDAVRSLAVGPATSLSTVMGPLTEPAAGKLHRALTSLEPGESWLVEPQRLDDVAAAAGIDPDRMWTPGLRDGVAPGSFFHLTEVFGPVLGIMRAATLDEAIELQNAVSFGLTGGIHSLDAEEVEHWLDRVEVGNAYVNRHITGAIVQRQSFGGWKGSVVGPGAKAGGPNYVAQLGTWSDTAADAGGPPSRGNDPAGWLAWAEASDADAWAREFGVAHDETGLAVEENTFRYRPVEQVTVRVGDGALPVEVRRVLAGARRAGVHAVVVPASDAGWGVPHDAPVPHAEFAAAVADGRVSGRVRVLGEAPGLREAAAGRLGEVTVLDGPVLAAGRRELLTFLREQAISRTKHRYGHLRD
ncbi:proline dehydrogenase family protein [Isoptericola chiayiensis]|uniref:L-glutamate gamma-semialdehyde dehydrogenase n=1 Tax=Isoptericola chiayiensis TaxID=579446 RepID=A0ABP8Y3R2_9MICO|nr:bifunctional proline dehydrogenase/L-glutamate gamma-semialdehyde dehydrogenase [Isoptericola chiayiensis]NOV99366.1 RHH-type proline utilization regulon transcriptional repressor/proline dehydrogenase/delta 1-pyrroline-5-carboxylate dehydrogenase [Isoptericola chiayiensis]